MKTSLKISIQLDSEEKAKGLFSVLNPETRSDSRNKTELSQKDNFLLLSLSAEDRNASRAAVNSYGKWIRLYDELGGIN